MFLRPALLSLTVLLASAQFARAAEQPEQAQTAQAKQNSVIGEYTDAAEQLVDEALSYLGIRYRFGGTSPATGLDCSGLVLNVFRNAVGLDLPRTAREMANLGDKIGRQDLKPGDLVFFNTRNAPFSHVGVYIGGQRFVHAPSSNGKVRIDLLTTNYYAQRFETARTYFD